MPGDFIDIHCHILPGLDDGAKSMDEALAMARMAVADGIGTMVATPHLQPGLYDNGQPRIHHAVSVLSARLQQEQIPLTLHYATEARFGPHLLGLLRARQLPCYSSHNQPFLLEFPPNGVPPGALYLVELLRHQRITPVIAHPERIRTFRQNVDALRPYLELGCLTQVTASSLSGQFGEGIRQVAETMLDRRWVHFLASDGHSFYRRHPILSDGYQAAVQRVGATRARALVIDNPARLLQGETVG